VAPPAPPVSVHFAPPPPTAKQTGAPAAKQQAAVGPLVPSTQLSIVAPG
jgi:hypothetical protein